ncbi:hypothetical protein [Acidimangrovimonas pyrenivorans]|uniref:Uncharacterized protein n=1 Tax=Acidimangrovimonas pyrenivorans TaxID=2030798 RepID=A0ABV7AMX7_9RHOB
MQAPTTLTTANDNPGGATQIDTALIGLVRLLARAELRRAANTNAAPGADTKEASQ